LGHDKASSMSGLRRSLLLHGTLLRVPSAFELPPRLIKGSR
jgi:hypothetical protein